MIHNKYHNRGNIMDDVKTKMFKLCKYKVEYFAWQKDYTEKKAPQFEN